MDISLGLKFQALGSISKVSGRSEIVQARILSWINGVTAWFRSLERRQRITYIAAAALVLVALLVLILVLASPNRTLFHQASDIRELTEVRSALIDEGIRYWVGGNGLAIYVNERDVLPAQVAYEMTSRASVTDFSWPDALDASGLTASRRIIDQSALLATQTRIENSLTMIRGVARAQVILDIPPPTSFFIPSGEDPTASVTLHATNQFNRNAGDTLARIVQRAVLGLELENILISDQYGNVVFSGETSQNGFLTVRSEVEAAHRSLVERDIRSIMSSFADQTNVVSNFTHDWAVITTESLHHFNPTGIEGSPTGFLAADTIIRASSTMTDVAAEPGMAAMDLMIPVYPGGFPAIGETTYFEQDRQFINDMIRTIHEDQRGGAILTDDSSVAVTGTNFVTFYEEFFNQGFYDAPEEMTWEQFRETHVAFTIVDHDPRIDEMLQTATGLENVTLLMVNRYIFEDMIHVGMGANEILILTLLGLFILMLAYGLLKRARPDDISELEPELAVEDLLVSTQLEEDRERELSEEERLREIKMNQDSEIKQLIEKFIDSRPEAAAQLLRNWLNEDWD